MLRSVNKAFLCRARSYLAVSILAYLGIIASNIAIADTKELSVLTWADYLDPDIVAEFEQTYGISLSIEYFESDDHRDAILSSAENNVYDLVMINGLMVNAYSEQNLLAPISEAMIANVKHIDPQWRTAFPTAERYGVPYFWGTLGIAYRKDLIDQEITSWRQFFQPSDQLKGKISLLKSSRDVLGMALKTLGYSANTDNRSEIREAGELLQKQKPYVKSYEYVSLNEDSALVTGEILATMVYSGDALMVSEHNENIAYVVPEEGGNLWVDYWAILQSSSRKDYAELFLNFLNDPKIAARNAEYVYYASPNTAAYEFVSEEYKEDTVIHPDSSVINRSEIYRELNSRAQKTVNEQFGLLIN